MHCIINVLCLFNNRLYFCYNCYTLKSTNWCYYIKILLELQFIRSFNMYFTEVEKSRLEQWIYKCWLTGSILPPLIIIILRKNVLVTMYYVLCFVLLGTSIIKFLSCLSHYLHKLINTESLFFFYFSLVVIIRGGKF